MYFCFPLCLKCKHKVKIKNAYQIGNLKKFAKYFAFIIEIYKITMVH